MALVADRGAQVAHRAVRNLRGDVAVGVPVHLHPRLDRLVSAAGGAECADQVGVGHGQAVAFADPAASSAACGANPDT